MTTNPSQQIRPIIECFCQILSSHGFSTITPEIFRLAKFNRDEAVSGPFISKLEELPLLSDNSTLAIIIRNYSFSTNEK